LRNFADFSGHSLNSVLIDKNDTSNISLKHQDGTAGESHPMMNKTILIVDDHADIRRLIRMTLEFEDYKIYEAADGDAALSFTATIRPDVILLDVMMPGAIDGLEVCRRIKATPALSGVQVILLSARGQARDREAGLQAGADAYLIKPFSPLQLIEYLATLPEHA
jgi:DNA-binding response OmpR family regulator